MLTVDRLRQFVPVFLSKLHVESLIHGNISKAEAVRTIKLVESKLVNNVKDLTPLLPRQMLLHREIQLPNGILNKCIMFLITQFLFENNNFQAVITFTRSKTNSIKIHVHKFTIRSDCNQLKATCCLSS